MFTTDITAFFHQVMIDKRDRAVFRYLWFEDETMQKVRVKAFLAHIFGSAASSCVTSFTLRHLSVPYFGKVGVEPKSSAQLILG